MEAHPRRGQRRHARSRGERDGQRLAALPDPDLPLLGPDRVLPIRRRLRFPRPAAGRHGPRPCRAGADPRAPAARSRAPVPRGRRAALVASAGRARRADAFLRRLSVAALRHLPLRLLPGRHRGARREGALPRGPAAQAGRGILLRPAEPLGGVGHALRTRRPRHRARTEVRRTRPAADGLRRLERRHEPGGRSGPGRKCVAGLLSLRRAHPVCPAGAPARRPRLCRAVPRPGAAAAAQHRAPRLGRPMVPARLFRQRRARSARNQIPSARSTPCRKAGRSSAARATRRARGRRWNPSTSAWSAGRAD